MPEPTLEQREEFLRLLSEGQTKKEAGEAVGSTGTRFKFLAKRDPGFRQSYDLAVHEGEMVFTERLRTEYRRRALAGADKLIHNLALIHLEEFAPLVNKRIEIGNMDGNPFELAAKKYFDRDKLSDEELDTLIELLEKAQPSELTANGSGELLALPVVEA